MRFKVEAEWIVGGREAARRLAEALMVMGAETAGCAPLDERPVRVGCPVHGTRTIELDGPEEMCGECRVLGTDGKPLGWQDGLPTERLGQQ